VLKTRPTTTVLSTLAIALLPALARGDVPRPPLGSTNTVTADPPVRRPRTTPCVVKLFAGVTFADYSPKSFAYAPPSACPGPWAKVVLDGDFAVSAGRQFDRTANVWIGGANVYFGTTPEPSSSGGQSWHVERDLTDYAPLFAAAQSGEVDLGNTVDATYTGVITGTASLELYPATRDEPAPRSADAVLPLSAGPTGGTVALSTGASTLAQSFTLPTNIERAYLDVVAQSQNQDEFWYTCVPSAVAGEVESCGGTGFRETEITIDGTPAGVAPVYPWIYTGGIDPFLWQPIPGVQTLDLVPYRVDLTPFAGLLDDGSPHTIALSVFNADNYFSATATLLLYLDHGADRAHGLKGAVTSNTLTAAGSPTITNALTAAADGSISGTVTVAASRRYAIEGYVETSHGRVTSEVAGDLAFSNAQSFTIDATQYVQDITQKTTILARTTTRALGIEQVTAATFDWPLTVSIAAVAASDGSSTQTTTIRQAYDRADLLTEDGFPVAFNVVSNVVAPTDTLAFDATGAFLGSRNASSSQRYFRTGTGEGCYSRALVATSGALTSVTDGAECGHGH
jgi:hypothetical protein